MTDPRPALTRVRAAEAAADGDDNDAALRECAEARRVCVELGDRDAMVRALAVHSRLLLRDGAFGEAAVQAREARHIAQGLDRDEPIGVARAATARVLLETRDWRTGLKELRAAWPGLRNAADVHVRFHCMNLLGNAALGMGDLDEAGRWFRRARHHARAARAEVLEVLATGNIAEQRLELGDQLHGVGRDAEAVEHWMRGIATLDEVIGRLQHGRVVSVRNLEFLLWTRAELHHRLGDHRIALAAFRELREAQGGVMSPFLRMVAWPAIVRVLVDLGEPDTAWEEFREGLRVAEAAGATAVMAELCEVGAHVAELRRDPMGALALYKRFHRLTVQLAEERAAQRATVLEVRFDTDRVRAEAQAEQERLGRLESVHAQLAIRAVELQRAATTDALTGLGNRRHMDAALEDAHVAARRSGHRVSLAVLDIDRFKDVNDRHSHAVGDEVLRCLARLIREHCRGGDAFGRVGGEEFMAILHDTGSAEAAEACERLRRTVAGYAWDRISPGLEVTVSIGVCEVTGDEELADWLTAVDERLYAAKAAGRNRVVHAAEGGPV